MVTNQHYQGDTDPTQEAKIAAYEKEIKQAQAAGTPPVQNKYGPVADVIYITANLTEPATLKVDTGGQSRLISLPEGSTIPRRLSCRAIHPPLNCSGTVWWVLQGFRDRSHPGHTDLQRLLLLDRRHDGRAAGSRRPVSGA
jgi:hypothetical protein